jgi:hypothetical protein
MKRIRLELHVYDYALVCLVFWAVVIDWMFR